MQRIDLKAILQRTVSGLYGDLVTRPTGQAVRGGVEEVLADLDGEQVAVIDFSTWDREGQFEILGPVDDLFRRAFSVLSRRGTAGVEEIAAELAVPAETARDAMESLLARRLVQFRADRYAVPAP
jgi:hypothetical protein